MSYYNNKFLLSGSNDKTVIIWNLDTFTFNRTLSQFNDAVLSIDYTLNYLAIGLKNSEILIYENNYIKKNEIKKQKYIASFYTCNTIAVLPNSNIVIGRDDGYIGIWHSTSFELFISIIRLISFCLVLNLFFSPTEPF